MNKDLLLENYNYDLPLELIASRPTAKREECRLLVYKKSEDSITHTTFDKLADFLPAKSHLVLNSSKVIPCRLIGAKESGGKAEIFILGEESEEDSCRVLIKCSGKKKIGDTFLFSSNIAAKIFSVEGTQFFVKFVKDSLDISSKAVIALIGKMPIPPYIREGNSDEQDLLDYQTVFAKEEGSVAAPTAGLHFSDKILNELKSSGIDHSFVTLHVGHGTFAPVKSKNIVEHSMHKEFYSISQITIDNLEKARDEESAVIAVGTTAFRAIESSLYEKVVPGQFFGTDIFIYPGKKVRSINGLITNFHLPKSTLLMLVSSLIGRAKTLELYQEAIDLKYRFYSYGDAMLLLE